MFICWIIYFWMGWNTAVVFSSLCWWCLASITIALVALCVCVCVCWRGGGGGKIALVLWWWGRRGEWGCFFLYIFIWSSSELRWESGRGFQKRHNGTAHSPDVYNPWTGCTVIIMFSISNLGTLLMLFWGNLDSAWLYLHLYFSYIYYYTEYFYDVWISECVSWANIHLLLICLFRLPTPNCMHISYHHVMQNCHHVNCYCFD